MGRQIFKIKNTEYYAYYTFRINEIECRFEKYLYGQLVKEDSRGCDLLGHDYPDFPTRRLDELIHLRETTKLFNSLPDLLRETKQFDSLIRGWRAYLDRVNQTLVCCEEVTNSAIFSPIFKVLEPYEYGGFETKMFVSFMNGIANVILEIDIHQAEKQYEALKEQYYKGLREIVLNKVVDYFEEYKDIESNMMDLKLSHPHIYEDIFPKLNQKQDIEKTMHPVHLSIHENGYFMSFECEWIGGGYGLGIGIDKNWAIEVNYY